MNRPAPPRGERGFTLIELMIGMLLTGIVLSFIFLVSGKMSTAYFGQSQVAEVQETLRTVRAAITADVRQAGFFTPLRADVTLRVLLLGERVRVVNQVDLLSHVSLEVCVSYGRYRRTLGVASQVAVRLA